MFNSITSTFLSPYCNSILAFLPAFFPEKSDFAGLREATPSCFLPKGGEGGGKKAAI